MGREGLLRSALLAIALLCLCLIIWKPQYPVHQPAGRALVLTETTKAIPDSVPVFALPEVKVPASVQKIISLPALERNRPDIEQVYIAGYGLEPEQLTFLKRLRVSFLAKQPPPGTHWLAYNRQVKEGELLTVSGSYQNVLKDSIIIRLITAEGVQDSARLPSGKAAFVLQARPQVAGNYLGTIQISQESHLRSEPLPYQVEPKKPLSIVMIQAFPSFEFNYLKDWLAAQKHNIRVRTRISRDQYASQRINVREPVTPKASTSPILAAQELIKTDLVIADAESLARLSATEQKQLKKSVVQGLGLLLLPDEQRLQKPEILGQQFSLTPTGITRFVPASIPTDRSFGKETGKYPYSFSPATLLIPVVHSRAKETIAAYIPSGTGRLGAQLATDTFTWILNGEEKTYSAFWTEIIQALSRRKGRDEFQIENSPFLWQDNSSRVLKTDSTGSPAHIRYSTGVTEVVQPRREATKGLAWIYPFRPAEPGWTQFRIGKDTGFEQMYVLPSQAWTDLKQADWWRSNQSPEVVQRNYAQSFVALRSIALGWFFAPLLVSLSLLWWREKGNRSKGK